MVKLRILISMIQVLSQIGVVYSIPFPSLYANLLRWTGLLELNFIDILPLGCVMTVGFHFSLLVRTLVLPALLSVALAAKVARAPAKVADLFNGLNFFVLFLIYTPAHRPPSLQPSSARSCPTAPAGCARISQSTATATSTHCSDTMRA